MSAAEPEAARAVKEASAALEDAEVALACATDENADGLTETRNRARTRSEQVQLDLETIRRRQRGINAKMPEADAAVQAAKADWDKADFCGELQRRYRQHLAAATAAFAKVLHLGWIIERAVPGSLYRLSGVAVPDFRSDRQYLIKSNCAWLDDAADPVDLRLVDGSDPAIAALAALLEPIGRADTAATRLMPRIVRDRMTREQQQPAQSRPRALSPAAQEAERIQKMTPREYDDHRRAKDDADRVYPKAYPQSGILRG